ncbi:MAG: DUF7017 domain-containing protein [Bacteroidales bacterium]
MESLYRINQEIFDYRQKQQYPQALETYKEKIHGQYPLAEIKETDLLVANILHCLRKTGRPEAGLSFLKNTLHLTPLPSTHPATWIEYGWCLYFNVKSIPPLQVPLHLQGTLHEAVEYLTLIDPAKDYLLMNLLFLELSRKLMQKGAPVALLASLVKYLQPTWFYQKAPGENKATSEKQGHLQNRASDMETFMVRKARALLLNGEFEPCIETCQVAFAKLEKFHHGNQLWLARTLAMALQQTGRTEEAIEKMTTLLQKKDDWFLHHEIACMYLHNNQPSPAKQHICRAALQQGHTPYKVGLYEEMGTIFASLFDKPLLCNHLWLAAITRQEQQWKISQILSGHFTEHQCQQPAGSAKELYKVLSQTWIAYLGKQVSSQASENKEGIHASGHITRILNEGENGDGFITTLQGQSIYFRIKKTSVPAQEILPGTPVKVFARLREYKGKTVYNALWVKKDSSKSQE